MDAVASRLETELPGSAQVVAVCGKNVATRVRLQAQKAAGRWPGVGVEVRGFTSDMSSYMEAADCLITKAGPGTLSEATLRAMPTLISSFLPGQEYGNVRFCIERGFGEFASSPKAIAERVSAWLQNEQTLKNMSTAARAASTPHATRQIADDLLSLLDGRGIDGHAS